MRWKCPECHTDYTFPTPPPSGVAYCPRCWCEMDPHPVTFTERVLQSEVIPDRLKGIAAMMSHNGRCV